MRMMFINIRWKRIMLENAKIGDIVFWCGYGEYNGVVWPRYEVKWGKIESFGLHCTHIEMYELRNRMIIDGVSIWDWQPDGKKKKLPKGWTYNTRLFDIDYEPISDNFKNARMDSPEDLQMLIDEKVFIRVKDNINYHPEAEISKDGWELVRRSDEKYKPTYIELRNDRLYSTYAEAKAEVDAKYAEFQRQAELSDEEWSKEKILETINRWVSIYGLPSQERYEKIYDFLMNHERVEDVEVRIYMRHLQWKYDKNKKWLDVEES